LGPGRVGTAGEEVDDRGEEQERRLLEVDLGEGEPVLVEEVGPLVRRLGANHLAGGRPSAPGELRRLPRDVARPGLGPRRAVVATPTTRCHAQQRNDRDHPRTPRHHDLPSTLTAELARTALLGIQSTPCPPSPSFARRVCCSGDGGTRTWPR